MAIYFFEWNLAREFKTQHHHTRNPEEQNIPTRPSNECQFLLINSTGGRQLTQVRM